MRPEMSFHFVDVRPRANQQLFVSERADEAGCRHKLGQPASKGVRQETLIQIKDGFGKRRQLMLLRMLALKAPADEDIPGDKHVPKRCLTSTRRAPPDDLRHQHSS